MVSFMYRLLWLSCGIVSPVYSSYKTIKDKNVKEYVRLMMYWVVFAIFSFVEVFTDFFLSWSRKEADVAVGSSADLQQLPFYFEVKVVVLLWLVLPATRGSTAVYARYIHPMLISREKEIDSYVKSLKDHCFDFLVFLGSKGFGMFTHLIMTVTIKGQAKLASHLRSLSLSDLSGVDKNTLQRTESLQGSRIKSSTKRARLLRFNTISSPTNRSEMDIVVRSKSRFHDNVNSSRTSILEDDFISNSEHESASEALPRLKLPNKEPTDLIARSEFIPITQCPSSPAVDNASSFLQNDLTLNCTSIPKSEKAVCSTVKDESLDVISRTSIEISSSSSSSDDTGFHRSPTQTTPLPSRNEASPSILEECSQIVKVELPEQHSSDSLNQSSFKANPSSCPEPPLLKKSITRPSTKSSGFTKTNFLRSLKFFDARGSKSIKMLDSNPRPK